MAIVPYEKQIAVNPVGRTVSQFSTNMPEPDLRGVQRFAEIISSIGEDQMKTTADEAATLAAGQATIVNPDGSYAVIETPSQFGAYAAGKFNDAVEKVYVDRVYRDLEMQYITISTNPNLSARDKISQMTAFQESTLKNVDPKYAQGVAENSRRELSQRVLAILSLEQGRVYTQTIKELDESSRNNLDKAISILSAGPNAFVDADVAFNNSQSSMREQLTLSGSQNVEAQLKIREDIYNGAKWFSSTLNQIQNEGQDGSLSSSQLQTLINILDGTQLAGDAAFGITPDNAILNMTDETRKYFSSKLKVMLQQLNSENSEKAKEYTIDDIATKLGDGSYNQLEIDIISTSNQQVIAMTKYLERLGIGGPFTPAGVIALSRATKGDLPSSIYDPHLNKILTLDPKTEGPLAENILTTYLQMKSVPDSIDGKGNIDATKIVDIKTRFVLEYLNKEVNVNRVNITSALQKVMAIANNTESDTSKINQKLFDIFSVTSNREFLEEITEQDISEIPIDAQNTMLMNAQYGVMLNLPKEDIIKQVNINYNNEWTNSSMVFSPNGNGKTNADIPFVPKNIQGNDEQTQDWVKQYINIYLQDFIDTKTENKTYEGVVKLMSGAEVMAERQGFNVPIDKMELGKNLFFVPTGGLSLFDETGVSAQKYNLVYKDENGIPITLLESSGRPYTLIPAKAAALYKQHLSNVRMTSANNPNIKVAPPYFAETSIVGFRGGGKSPPTNYDPDTVFKPKKEHMELPSTYNNKKVSVSKAAQPWMSIISEAATANGIGSDVQEIVKMISFESQFDPNAKNKLSSASGLGQLLSSTWNERGAAKGLERTPENELKVSIEYMAYLKNVFVNDFKRKPNTGEWYILYNQGPSGGPALLKADPNSNAIQTISRFYTDPRNAVNAIINNLTENSGLRRTDVTSGQVVKYLKSKMGY